MPRGISHMPTSITWWLSLLFESTLTKFLDPLLHKIILIGKPSTFASIDLSSPIPLCNKYSGVAMVSKPMSIHQVQIWSPSAREPSTSKWLCMLTCQAYFLCILNLMEDRGLCSHLHDSINSPSTNMKSPWWESQAPYEGLLPLTYWAHLPHVINLVDELRSSYPNSISSPSASSESPWQGTKHLTRIAFYNLSSPLDLVKWRSKDEKNWWRVCL